MSPPRQAALNAPSSPPPSHCHRALPLAWNARCLLFLLNTVLFQARDLVSFVFRSLWLSPVLITWWRNVFWPTGWIGRWINDFKSKSDNTIHVIISANHLKHLSSETETRIVVTKGLEVGEMGWRYLCTLVDDKGVGEGREKVGEWLTKLIAC